MATLRDLGPEPFEVEPFEVTAAGIRAVAAPRDRWIVLVEAGEPVTAVAPGTVLAGGAQPPEIIVAVADLGQGIAYSSAAFEEHASVSALVLTEGAARDEIAGVIDGAVMRRAIARGALRGSSDTVLPGPSAIPVISRSCGFFDGAVLCATMMTFQTRPAVMPACPNSRGMAAHQFRW
jgi:hypothetical protein